MNNPHLTRSIMIRIHAIYWLRRCAEPLVYKSVAFAILLILFVSTVSVPHVIENAFLSMKQSGNALFFFSSAFSQSLFMVKLITIALSLMSLALMKDMLERVQNLHFSSGITR